MENSNKKTGLYIHIPFCVKKCNYCAFLSFPADESPRAEYTDALINEIRMRSAGKEKIRLDTVYIGGGTPSVLDVSQLSRIIKAVRQYYDVASDAEITEYLLDERKDFALDEGILDQISDSTDMVFIADPNNPNGRLIEPGLKKAIIEKCEACGAVLVIDECFYPLTEAGPENEAVTDNALHLRAFTKTFAIPGIRIGYMLSLDTELLDKIRKHLPEWNVSRIAERTGEAAANVLESTNYLRASVRMIKQEREYLTGQLEKLGVRVYSSDTNYLLIKCGSDLYEKLLGKGILIRRCANFSGLDDTYFRIAVRQHEDNVELINVLGKVL